MTKKIAAIVTDLVEDVELSLYIRVRVLTFRF